jgi:hypothetical protein
VYKRKDREHLPLPPRGIRDNFSLQTENFGKQIKQFKLVWVNAFNL